MSPTKNIVFCAITLTLVREFKSDSSSSTSAPGGVTNCLTSTTPSSGALSQGTLQMVQDALACFTFSTTTRIHRTRDLDEDKNIVFSPIDLYVATMLAHLGARGDSRKRLGRVLGIREPRNNVHARHRREQPRSIEDIYETVGHILNQTKTSNLVAIQYGAGIWIHNDFAIKSTYIEDARSYFGIEVRCTNFKDQNVASTELINNDISKKTHEKIPKFFLEPVSTGTQSVIPSTLSAVASWAHKFNPSDTYETAFHSGEDGCDDTNTCIMMNLQTIPYVKDEATGIQGIEIPFADPNLVFYVILPQSTLALEQMVANPNKNVISRIIDSMQPTKVRYHIPKLSLEAHIDQLELIRKRGRTDLAVADIAEGLNLSHLEQVIGVELNEEGLGGCPLDQARNAPSVENVTDSSAIEFVVDRPFIFCVSNKLTRAILIHGVIYKPYGYDKK